MENTSEHLSKLMTQKSDMELMRIVTLNNGHETKDFVEAARKELDQRQLDPQKTEALKADVIARFVTSEKLNYTETDRMFRYIHLLVDGAIIYVVWRCLTFIAGGLISFGDDGPNSDTTLYLILIMGALTYFGYYIFMEHRYQKTVGKFLTESRVVTVDGDRCSLKQIVKRTFCRLIPYDKYSFMWNNGNGFYHDYLSDTIVIRDEVFKRSSVFKT